MLQFPVELQTAALALQHTPLVLESAGYDLLRQPCSGCELTCYKEKCNGRFLIHLSDLVAEHEQQGQHAGP